jgi:CubicO group peptidase (beta-lactamase class C family)
VHCTAEKENAMQNRLPAMLAVALASGLASAPVDAQSPFRQKVTGALPKLEEMAQATIRAGEVPGLAIAVVLEDEVVYLKGFGVREAGKDAAVDPDTVFQLASCSKPISSTVVAALVSDGVVDWDTRIVDADPGFRLHEAYPSAEVTIRDLFAHRSGIPGNAGNDLEQLGFRRDEILRRVRNLEPSSSFRSGYAYSNFGLTEGAVAAARTAGYAWEDAADAKLFKPVGMAATSARYADFIRQNNRAALHIRRDGRWQALLTRDADAQSPAGGISSTARDLTRWLRLELGNGTFEGRDLIKAAAINPTHTPVTMSGQNPVTDRDGFYGLGWTIDYAPYGTIWGHNGAFSAGARTLVQLIPSRQIGFIILTNAFPTGVPEGIAASFFDIVFDGAPSRDWTSAWNGVFTSLFGPAAEGALAQYGTPPANASPELPPSAYAGTYANDYLGEARVVTNGAGLVLHLGPDGKIRHQLTHFNRDTFTIRASPEMQDVPDVPSPLTFSIGGDGRAVTLTIDALNSMGQGTLRRVSH